MSAIQSNSNNDTVVLELKPDQVNTIIETLLFASSVNICADWRETEIKTMIDLAKSFKKTLKKNINLQNLTFVEDENLSDSWTEDLHKTFAKCYKTLKLTEI